MMSRHALQRTYIFAFVGWTMGKIAEHMPLWVPRKSFLALIINIGKQFVVWKGERIINLKFPRAFCFASVCDNRARNEISERLIVKHVLKKHCFKTLNFPFPTQGELASLGNRTCFLPHVAVFMRNANEPQLQFCVHYLRLDWDTSETFYKRITLHPFMEVAQYQKMSFASQTFPDFSLCSEKHFYFRRF